MTRLLLPLLACAPVLLHGQINSISETWTVNSVGSVAANTLVQRDASNPTLVQAVASASGSFPDVLGIALSTATSGQPVQVARYGQAPCVLDSNSTAGHLAVVGSTTYSYCGDGGLPINGVPLASRVVGYFLQTQTAGSGNTALVELTPGLMGTALTSVPIISTTGSISAGSTGSAGCVNLFDLSGTQTQLCSPTMATGDLLVNGTALVLSGGALGTPSSGTLTNATGYPLSSLANPTAGAAFTFPASTSANLSINGTAPGTASSGTGEGDILDLTAGGGGACTGANCSGGAGGGSTFVHGNGGSSAPASGSGSSAGGWGAGLAWRRA